MTTLNALPTPQMAEVLTIASRLTSNERLLIARMLLDSVLAKEPNEDTEWQQLSLHSFEEAWNNDEDAIYDDWRNLYGIPAR